MATTPLEPQETTKRSGHPSMTSIIKRLSLRRNCEEPYLMNVSAVWGPSLELRSRRAWPSFQTSKQSGLNGKLLLDATHLGIKLRPLVSPSIRTPDSTRLTSIQLRRTLLALALTSLRRRRTLELPRASSKLTFRRSLILMASTRVIPKPSPAVKSPTLGKPLVKSNQVF